MMNNELTTGQLAAALGATLSGSGDVALSGITHDSRQAGPETLFSCVAGATFDGHDFAADAVAAGASALLCSRAMDLGVPEILVEDPRAQMGLAAAAIYGNPSDTIDVVGITGTNGKTTVASVLSSILNGVGRRCEVIGTLTGARTTPESTDLQRELSDMADRGVEVVAMEVSSHALALHRVDGTHFRLGIFTNLGSDHMDFHDTPEEYFAAKARLFEVARTTAALVNGDDTHGRLLSDGAQVPTSVYGLDLVENLEMSPVGSRFRWRGVDSFIPLGGIHNVSNAVCAAEAAVLLGASPDEIGQALADVPAIPGRFEIVSASNAEKASHASLPDVIVDFAHTPDALESLLGAARDLMDPGGALTVVFGCGGDRDRAKRPVMGRIATELADKVIVTNDNPRSEDAHAIINQILAGVSSEPVVEPDRAEAINAAITGSESGDVVVVAGKGHETGQTYSDRIEPFDDASVVAGVLDMLAEGSSAP